jgi:glyoxylase-like metal-dependent hydrolase (beta-lactamase superfamily II)
VSQSRLYFTNSGLFLSGGEACLIDPGLFPEELEAIAHFLAEQGAKPRAIVLTHSHWDHLLGPERFPGVRVITQANFLKETSAGRAEDLLWQVGEWEEEYGLEREKPFVIPQPSRTFKRRLTLELGELRLQLVHAPGHAADHLVIYEPGSRTLWAGDMLSDLEIPFVSQSLEAYEKTLEMLATWEVRILVPGHGHPTASAEEIQSRLAEDRAYLAELRERVSQAVAQGLNVGETVRLCAEMAFRHREENLGPHRLNIESVYLELGGKADRTRVGWNRL